MRLLARTRWGRPRPIRRPVSRIRQALGVLALFTILLGFLGYRYVTDEVRLRRYAERWLEDFSGGEARVERVELTPFAGLQLVGVTIATPASADFFKPNASREDRTIFTAGTVLLRLQPFSIITGELAVPQIVAENPRLTLIERVADGKGNWELMFQQPRKPDKPGKGPPQLPELRLRNMEVQEYHLTERGRLGGTAQTFFAGAKPDPEHPEVYDLHVTKIVSGDDAENWAGEAGHLKIDTTNWAVSGSLPSLTLEELLFAAPPEINRWLDTLALSGYVRAETFRFHPDGGNQARLVLRQARLSVPIDESEAADPNSGRYVQFSNVAGTIVFEGRQADIDLQGLFRESPIRLSGRLLLPAEGASGLSGIGLELDLSGTQIPLPRNDADTSVPEKRFVSRWHRLAAFVHDFDGRGHVDMAVHLRKEPGPDKGIEFVEGKLTVRNASAAFEEFPYRLHDMTGEVRFRRDGYVELVDLTGVHGKGRVTISGEVGGYTSRASVKLDIQGRNIALDADLLEPLQEDDRALCRVFLKRADLNLDVHLSRPASDWSAPRAKWTTRIDADFLDGEFEYSEFPYVLSGLHGRVRINGGTMRLDELTARSCNAVVKVSGTADRDEARASKIDVRLQATGLPLDEKLAVAMPAGTRELFRQYAAGGTADVSGRLFTAPTGGRLLFDLNAQLAEAKLSLPDAAGQLNDVHGLLHIVPDHLEFPSLKGRLGDSLVQLDGSLGLSSENPAMAVHVRSDSLALDESLRKGLPDALLETYDSLSPQGRVRLDLRYNSGAADTTATTQPSRTNTATAPAAPSYVAVVEPLNCKITYSHFPLPLDGVSGRIVLTPEETRIEKFSAYHGPTRLDLAGFFLNGDGAGSVEISSLHASDLQFTQELRDAMPWRLKRLWNDVQPTGACDLSLKDIHVTTGADGERKWQLQGRVDFHQAGLSVGPVFSDVDGSLDGWLGYNGQYYGLTELNLDQARIDGRLITNTRAKVERLLDSSTLRVREILGTLYEGSFMGELDVDYAAKPPRFGLGLTARNVSLAGFLNATRASSEKPIRAQGRIEGTLALSGQFNRPKSRQGTGSIVIHEAQVLKLPMILGIMQIVHMAVNDDNAFHDALLDFVVDEDDLILERIDLRGKAISMVGAGRVHTSTSVMHLVLLVGSPLNLPKVAVLSELVEGVARELMEVHVEGTLNNPLFRAEVARSVRKTVETMTSVRVEPPHRISLKESQRKINR